MYEWTPEMGELSGFGGSYEEACRRMVKAGCEWFDASPNAEPKFSGYKGVFGLVKEDNDDAKAMTEAIMVPVGGDCTGAMHQATVGAVLFIRKNGWDEYVRQMSK